MVLQSSKEDNGQNWRQTISRRKPHGPHALRAFVTVLKNDTLRLVYQIRTDLRWSETTVALHEDASTSNHLTHAALSSTPEGRLFIVTWSSNRKLSAYLVTVNMPDPKPGSDTTATMIVDTIDSDISNPWSSDTAASGLFTEEDLANDSWNLSHLEIVPASDYERMSHHSPPTIFAVFTSPLASSDMTFSAYITSVVRRWTLQKIDEKFEISKPLPDVPLSPVVTSFQLVDNGNSLAITQSSGETTFWKPENMTQAFLEEEANEALSMSQSGFTFGPTATPLQLAFSPNACLLISLDPNTGSLQYNTMSFVVHPNQMDDSSPLDSSLDVAIASVVLAFARAVHSSSNTDDLLTCILTNFEQHHIFILLSQMYHTLMKTEDFLHFEFQGTEVAQLIHKQMANRILSFQAALGHTPSQSTMLTAHRSVSSKLAWITLHIRQVVTQFYFFAALIKQPQTQAQTQLDVATGTHPSMFHHDFITYLASLARWLLNLYRYIYDGLLEDVDREELPNFFLAASMPPDYVVADVPIHNPSDLPQMSSQQATEYQNRQDRTDLAILLLVSPWPRYLGRMALKLIRMAAVPAFPQLAETLRVHGDGKGLGNIGLDRLFDIAKLSFPLQQQNQQAGGDGDGLTNEDRARIEIEVLSTGQIPEVWRKVVSGWAKGTWNVIYGDDVRMINGLDVNRLKMFVNGHALTWEEVGIEGVDKMGRGMDVHRKIMVGGDIGVGVDHQAINNNAVTGGALAGAEGHRSVGIRHCARCGGRSEDMSMGREWNRQLLTYVAKTISKCVCEGGWIVG